MPFDGIHIETPALRRARLMDALRAPMPRSFVWNFHTTHMPTTCGTAGCAVGLAYELGLCDKPRVASVADAIGISRRDARKTFIPFLTKARYGVARYADITPAMVAEVLEKVAANDT